MQFFWKHLHNNKGDENVSKLIWIVIAFVIGALLLSTMSVAFRTEGAIGGWLSSSLEEWFGEADGRDGSVGGGAGGSGGGLPGGNPGESGGNEATSLEGITLVHNGSSFTSDSSVTSANGITGSGMNYSALFTQSNLSTLVASGYLSTNGSANNGNYITGETKIVDAASANAVLGSKYFADGTYVIETQNKDSQWIRIGVDESGNVVIPAISEDPSVGGCLIFSARPDNSSDEEDKIIPEGAVYYVGVTETELNPDGYADSCDKVLTAGSKFPETVSVGDVYVYEDYEYRYNMIFQGEWFEVPYNNISFFASEEPDYEELIKAYGLTQGWGVRIINPTKTEYSDMLSSINNNFVTSAFATYAYCENLINAPVLSENLTSLYIAFSSCSSLKKAPVIPSSAKSLEETFSYCYELVSYEGNIDMDGNFTNFIIPNNVTNVKSLFRYCENLILPPAMPTNITDMERTFQYCASLTETPEIPNGVISMYETFSDCSSLTKTSEIPNSVTDMSYTFYGCTSLTEAPEIPNGVLILKETFRDCTSLTKIQKIPESVTNMSATFAGCQSLENAPKIPSNVNSINYIFEDCINLKGIVEITTSQIHSFGNPFLGTVNPIVIKVPVGSTTYTTLINGNLPANVTVETF